MALQKQILIPVDNNPASFQALGYCALLFAEDATVTFQLLNCLPHATATILPESLDPGSSLQPHTQEGHYRTERSESILSKAAEYLRRKGVANDRISRSMTAPVKEIATSIIFESNRSMVDSVAVSRRGIGYIGEVVLGSVSATLLRNLHTTPLWIIDGAISSKKIMMAVDGSIHSLRAVDHLAFMLRNRTDISIFLYHCSLFLAPPVSCSLERFYEEKDRSWCDSYLAGDGCLFRGPRQLLIESGIPAERLITLPETTHLEESTSIIHQARVHNCGTICIGRRGPEVQKGFFGGVSNRTIRQSQDMAVWVVG